ncbi:unnamed protein product, partial [Gulo gulo]
ARCRGAGDGASFPENRNCYRPGISPERRQRASAGRERKAECRAEGRLWRSLRKGLFLRSRVSPRAGKADTHARLGSFSTAAAPPATCQQMPQAPHGRHGTGGEQETEMMRPVTRTEQCQPMRRASASSSQ